MRFPVSALPVALLALLLAGCSGPADSGPKPEQTGSGKVSLTDAQLVSALPFKKNLPKGYALEETCTSASDSCGNLPDGHGSFVALTPPDPVNYQGEGEHLLAATIHWDGAAKAKAAQESARSDVDVFDGDFAVEKNQLTTAGLEGTGKISDYSWNGWTGWEVRVTAQSTHAIGKPAPFSIVRVFLSRGEYTAQVDFRRWQSRATLDQVTQVAEETVNGMVDRLNQA